MFGGLTFLLGGNMCVGVLRDDLIVRLSPESAEEALVASPDARPMDLTGRPMKGWIMVAPGGTGSPEGLSGWVIRAVEFVSTLPPK